MLVVTQKCGSTQGPCELGAQKWLGWQILRSVHLNTVKTKQKGKKHKNCLNGIFFNME